MEKRSVNESVGGAGSVGRYREFGHRTGAATTGRTKTRIS